MGSSPVPRRPSSTRIRTTRTGRQGKPTRSRLDFTEMYDALLSTSQTTWVGPTIMNAMHLSRYDRGDLILGSGGSANLWRLRGLGVKPCNSARLARQWEMRDDMLYTPVRKGLLVLELMPEVRHDYGHILESVQNRCTVASEIPLESEGLGCAEGPLPPEP